MTLQPTIAWDRYEPAPLVFDWALGMTRPETTLACDYWRSRCAGAPMPSRSDIDPVQMRKFLANSGLVELSAAGGETLYRIRQAGTQWEQVFGPMTGKLLDEFLSGAIEQRWRQVFDAVCSARTPLRVTTRLAHKRMSWLSMEMFVAPLGQNGQVTMLLVCFTAWNAKGFS